MPAARENLAFTFRLIAGAALLAGLTPSFVTAKEPARFFRGLNLNGPPVKIDGFEWEGKDSPNYECKDKEFENQNVPLIPPTDDERAKMIRSSRWGGNNVLVKNLPAGRYSVLLYVWEDNAPEKFSITVDGKPVVTRYISGPAGKWERLGPWFVDVENSVKSSEKEKHDGQIRIISLGGAANFSGVELWTGEHDGSLPSDSDSAGLEFFEKRVRPLLAKHCYSCHSRDAKEVEGDLVLDSRIGSRKGGFTGPAVVPYDPARSLLLAAVKHTSDSLQMPPEKKLSDAEIADLEEWIKRGATDPRQGTAAPVKQIDLEAARKFWSLRPIVAHAPPVVPDADWSKTEIDRFIKSQLDRRGLKPVALADKRTLIRRATYDLTGLPPTPENLAAFVADDSPDAFAKLVDRLLASPQYGERWGRHWMDLVRYADTAGDNSDYPIPQAYLYRNYIIAAFNSDKPYDQFLREQIAGDLLPADSDERRNEQIIATGYLAISRRFGSLVKDYPQHLTIEDTIENLGRTVLGLSVSCARCHDHKFDPISQRDYYGLYGIFESTKYPFPGIELDKKPRDFSPLYEGGKPGKALAYAVAEGKPADARLQQRGEPLKPLDVVPRRFIEVLGGQPLPPQSANSSGRLQLAEWLIEPRNPLTARVMVNRIWLGHFGEGLVPSASDFGVRGQPPSHPEMLDYLATEFVKSGWSIKQMHRRMMLTRTYQLAGGEDAANLASDPQNVQRWRFTRRRLDAESLRDTLLSISGQLDPTPHTEPHPFPPVDKWDFTQHHPFRGSYPSNRRSVYLMTGRLNALPYYNTFDGADRNATTPRRDSSVTTLQSLYLLNDEFVHRAATGLAERLRKERDNTASRIERAFELTLNRPPSEQEKSAATAFVEQARAAVQAAGEPADRHEQASLESFARVLFRVNEFLYVE